MVATAIVAEYFRTVNPEELSQTVNSADSNYEELRKMQCETERGIRQITEAISKGYSDALLHRLHELEAENRRIEAELEATSNVSLNLSGDSMKNASLTLRSYLQTSNDPEARELIRDTVREVTVSNEGVTIQLEIS